MGSGFVMGFERGIVIWLIAGELGLDGGLGLVIVFRGVWRFCVLVWVFSVGYFD